VSADGVGDDVPLIEIRALPQPAGVKVGRVLDAVTHAVAAVLDEEPRGTWATWEEIPFEQYSEGGVTVTEQPPASHPPLVRVSGGARSEEMVSRILDTVSAILTRELGMEHGNAFVRWEELTPERLRLG
jgi:phenylpyruvate tautomerase PptA (4-oxalocrotonate tautomerase family)